LASGAQRSIEDLMHRIGTAGWSLPTKSDGSETHLYRYSRIFNCVEVNSSFYRPHRTKTWAKWARETSQDFRFSIKAPKTITHENNLQTVKQLLRDFFERTKSLEEKMGPVLFQLPPSLAFDSTIVEQFLALLRTLYKGEVVLEPRNKTWFDDQPEALLRKYRITRVAADPPAGTSAAREPGGDPNLIYYRLHGSPRTYYSKYEDDFLAALASKVQGCRNVWIIFDNTALSTAYYDALKLEGLVASGDF
jgi:uncharacterized protein YecE (DUF72 family)